MDGEVVRAFHGDDAVELHEAHALDQRLETVAVHPPSRRIGKSLEVKEETPGGAGVESHRGGHGGSIANSGASWDALKSPPRVMQFRRGP